MQKWVHRFLGLLLIKPFFKVFFNLRVSNKKNMEGLSGPLLIISNHKFLLDCFVFGACVPFSSQIYPIRFMGDITGFHDIVTRFLEKLGVIKLIYCIFAVFPAIRGKGLEEALKIPKKILENNGTVFLYPEGEIMRGDIIGQFKRGAAALALATGTKILPLAIKLGKPKLIGRDCFLKFGSVFSLPKDLSIEQGADYMRNIVENLYKSLPIFCS